MVVRGAVKRIVGMGNVMIRYRTDGKPAWRIEDGPASVVMFENIYADYGSKENYTFEQATKRSLVLKYGGGSYHNVVEGATLFVEDWVGQPFHLTNMQAWVRDLNTETYDHSHVVNRSSDLWILGHKTEKDQTIVETLDGADAPTKGG